MKKAMLLSLCLCACSEVPPPQSDAQTEIQVESPKTTSQSRVEVVQAPADEQPQYQSVQLKLKKGQTVEQLLSPYNVSSKAIYTLSRALKPHLPVNKMKIGQQFDLQLLDGDLAKIILKSGFDNQLHLTKSEDDWQLDIKKLATRQELLSAQGTINGSLYLSAQKQRVPIDVINRFILAFSHYVDFQRQIQKGDSFRLVYTRDCLISDETSHQVARLNYAEMTLSGETIRLVNFEKSDGSTAFYDENGRLAQSFLLKTPVDGARLSSHFGRRKHPILGYSRSHNGIDFGAPLGTPIMAAGFGTVVFTGRNGSFGNMVKLKHERGFETLYAHMQKFAKGLDVGDKVSQGQIIGYVGNTGLSQARHLHYEVHKYGKPVNPLKLKLSRPSNIKLKDEQLAQFEQYRKQMLAYFPVETLDSQEIQIAE